MSPSRVTQVSVVGCGKVAKVLLQPLITSRTIELVQVVHRNLDHTQESIRFLEAGECARTITELREVDCILVGTQDDQLTFVDEQLAQLPFIASASVVHLSGALAAGSLVSLVRAGACVGSLHLLRSVVEPSETISTLGGSFCALEGDECALVLLREWCAVLGLSSFTIKAADKLLYHAANSLMANYLLAVLQSGVQLYEVAGIPLEQRYVLAASMVEEVVARFFRKSGVNCLSGPLVRGDVGLIKAHLDELAARMPTHLSLYISLALQTIEVFQLESDSVKQVHRTLKQYQTNS